jgi:hypothetical protein
MYYFRYKNFGAFEIEVLYNDFNRNAYMDSAAS